MGAMSLPLGKASWQGFLGWVCWGHMGTYVETWVHWQNDWKRPASAALSLDGLGIIPIPPASLVAQLVKNLPAMHETQFNPWVGKIPWRKEWQPIPGFLPEKFHGQRSLVGYNSWIAKSRTPNTLPLQRIQPCVQKVRVQYLLRNGSERAEIITWLWGSGWDFLKRWKPKNSSVFSEWLQVEWTHRSVQKMVIENKDATYVQHEYTRIQLHLTKEKK